MATKTIMLLNEISCRVDNYTALVLDFVVGFKFWVFASLRHGIFVVHVMLRQLRVEFFTYTDG